MIWRAAPAWCLVGCFFGVKSVGRSRHCRRRLRTRARARVASRPIVRSRFRPRLVVPPPPNSKTNTGGIVTRRLALFVVGSKPRPPSVSAGAPQTDARAAKHTPHPHALIARNPLLLQPPSIKGTENSRRRGTAPGRARAPGCPPLVVFFLPSSSLPSQPLHAPWTLHRRTRSSSQAVVGWAAAAVNCRRHRRAEPRGL